MGIRLLDNSVESLDLRPQFGNMRCLIIPLDDCGVTRNDRAASVLLYVIQYLAWNMWPGFLLCSLQRLQVYQQADLDQNYGHGVRQGMEFV